jgi:glycosyltransferase involved in cell wall biosynthesis
MAALLSIVVPVFNEAESLEPLHAEIVEAAGRLGRFEVLYVDDGSTDASYVTMQRLAAAHDNVRVVKLRRNFGKATALTQGFAESRGDVIVTMDGDRQDDPSEIAQLVARLDEGYDLVSGWKQRRQDPITKTLPSRFYNWTVRKTTGLTLHDFNCGLKAYRRVVVDSLHVYGELHRYIPVLANDAGFKVTEEKVTHRRRMAGYSKYGWRRYMRGYLDLFTVLFLGRYRQRPQHLFGGLGTFMVVAGTGIDAYLLVAKIFGKPIGNRPLFVFANLLIVVGVQLFSAGLMAELFAFARARERRDEFEVERVVDAAVARAALGPEGTRAALSQAAAREFGDQPMPEEAAAHARREAERRERAARTGGPVAAPAAMAGGSSVRSNEPTGPGLPASGYDDSTSEVMVRRARLKAERLAAEAERTMGNEGRAGSARDFDADEARPRRSGGTQDQAGA